MVSIFTSIDTVSWPTARLLQNLENRNLDAVLNRLRERFLGGHKAVCNSSLLGLAELGEDFQLNSLIPRRITLGVQKIPVLLSTMPGTRVSNRRSKHHDVAQHGYRGWRRLRKNLENLRHSLTLPNSRRTEEKIDLQRGCRHFGKSDMNH